MKMTLFNFLFATVLLSTASNLWAQNKMSIDPNTSKAVYNEVGKVLIAKGVVVKIRPDKDEEIKVAEGHSFNEGDVVKTKPASFVKIKMIDDTEISLGPNTIFQFKKFEFKDPSDRKSVYGFLVGQMRANFPNKAKNADDIQIKTRAASLGIRGTEILANVMPKEDGKMLTEIGLLRGKVDVLNHASGKTSPMNPKDHYVTFTDTKAEKIFDEGTIVLNDETYKKLIAEVSATEIASFLDFYNEDTIGGRGPASLSAPKAEDDMDNTIYPVKKSKSKNWKDQLNKLNRHLHDYNSP